MVLALALLLGACSRQSLPETETVDIDSSSAQIVTSTPASSESDVHIQRGACLGHRR